VAQLVAPFVSIHVVGLRDPYRLPYKSASIVWFSINHLDVLAVYHMVLIANSICNCRFVADAGCPGLPSYVRPSPDNDTTNQSITLKLNWQQVSCFSTKSLALETSVMSTANSYWYTVWVKKTIPCPFYCSVCICWSMLTLFGTECTTQKLLTCPPNLRNAAALPWKMLFPVFSGCLWTSG